MIPAEFLKKVRAIEIASRRLVEQGLAGLYMSAFRGSGMQFREFRQYVYGDDVRHISWNVSARTQEPVLKLFEEERERTLFLLVDVSASLRRGPWARAKAERLAEVAATLALSAAEAGDKLGLILYSDRVEKVIPPAKGRTHLLRLIRDVLLFEAKGERTSPDLALKQLDRVLKKQAIVFLLSDMEVMPSDKVLRQCQQMHELIVVSVEDPREWALDIEGFFVEVQTAEEGRPVTLDTSSSTMKNYMLSHAATRREAISAALKKNGVEHLSLLTQEDYVPVLQGFFYRRAKHNGAPPQKGGR